MATDYEDLPEEVRIRVTLVALRKGESLQAHQVEGAVSIHVLRRRARISAAGDAVQLSAGGLAVLQEEVAHSAAALSDCTVLIAVAMASAASR